MWIGNYEYDGSPVKRRSIKKIKKKSNKIAKSRGDECTNGNRFGFEDPNKKHSEMKSDNL